jgi:metal-responsive CopG/Arc/MetJ family transcriptional regulator
MRISVVLPTDLQAELERCKRQERKTTSAIIREAVSLYLREHRRRSAGEQLLKSVEETRLSSSDVRRALTELERERGCSDRP